MSAYEPPTQNLAIFDPDVFTENDEPLTITTGSKYFLKYPNAQGTENLQAINVNGVLTANSTVNLNSVVNIPNNDMFVRGMRLGLGAGNQVRNTMLGVNNGNAITTGNNNTFIGALCGVANTTGRDNVFVGTFSGIKNTTGFQNTFIGIDAGNFTTTGGRNTHIGRQAGYYNTGSNNICIGDWADASGNISNSIAIGVDVKATANDTIVLGTSSHTTQIAGAVVVGTNSNLTMNAGTGRINQPVVVGDVSTTNSFKLSDFVFNSNNANGTATAFSFFDSFNGRGLYILPSIDSGFFGSTNRRGDCCLTSRLENNSAITISNYNTNMRNGLRVFTTDSSNCGLTLQCGQNSTNDWTEFAMNYNRGTNTTTTTFNNSINFNPTSTNSSRRLLSGLGTLSFTDISGNNSTNGSVVSRIWTDSSLVGGLNGMYYDCGINGGFHQFSARDGAGNVSTPIYYGASLTSVSNTFVVRNATTTSNRFDISTDGTQTTSIRARTSTNSTNGKININCDSVSAGGVITNNNILNINNSVLETKRPIQITYPSTAIPIDNSQLGFVNYGPTYSQISPTASASVRNYTDFDITDIGTFIIQLTISLVGSGNHTLTDCRFAMNNATATLPTSAPYNRSFVSDIGRTLSTTTTNYLTSTLPIQISATTKIYINYVLNWSGGGTVNVNINVSLTRVG
jgi:hypothetical protein